jgi:hypothetical protein
MPGEFRRTACGSPLTIIERRCGYHNIDAAVANFYHSSIRLRLPRCRARGAGKMLGVVVCNSNGLRLSSWRAHDGGHGVSGDMPS